MTTEDSDLTHKSEEYFNDEYEYIKSLKRESNEGLNKETEVQSLIISLRNNKACSSIEHGGTSTFYNFMALLAL